MTLTKSQLDIARVKIRRHYDLNRWVTDEEVYNEVTALQQGLTVPDWKLGVRAGYYDPNQQLALRLSRGPHPIET